MAAAAETATREVAVLFEVRVHELEGWVVLAPVGELDMAGGPTLRTEAVRQVAAGHRRVVVDLVGVDFVDSIGVGMLVAVNKRLRSFEGTLVLARPEPHVRRVLALAGVDRIIAVHDDLEGAVRAPVAS